MKKISTAKIKSQAAKKKVTIGIDLGDRSSRYCLLDEEGVVIVEASTPTTKAGIAKAFGAMARCRIALEAGGHSPWVSRQLQEFGHEVIVANPRNVRLIGESTRKDDRLDARTLARLARIESTASESGASPGRGSAGGLSRDPCAASIGQGTDDADKCRAWIDEVVR